MPARWSRLLRHPIRPRGSADSPAETQPQQPALRVSQYETADEAARDADSEPIRSHVRIVCVYVCMDVCMCMDGCMYTCVYGCMYVCVCMYVCIYCTHVCMDGWMDVRKYMLCMYECIYCMYSVCIYCMYIHTWKIKTDLLLYV